MNDTLWIGVYPGLTEEMLSFVVEKIEALVINKAVANNPDKSPSGYIIAVSKSEKNELEENFHRFNKLKHSTVAPKAFFGVNF